MLLVRFSTTKVDFFYPFSLLFSLFFARFFSFFLSQLVVPASRGHRNSDFSFQFSSFRLFCSYFLAVFLIPVLSDDCFFMFFLIYFLIICPNGLIFYFSFLFVLFFLYFSFDLYLRFFIFPSTWFDFLFLISFCCLFAFFWSFRRVDALFSTVFRSCCLSFLRCYSFLLSVFPFLYAFFSRNSYFSSIFLFSFMFRVSFFHNGFLSVCFFHTVCSFFISFLSTFPLFIPSYAVFIRERSFSYICFMIFFLFTILFIFFFVFLLSSGWFSWFLSFFCFLTSAKGFLSIYASPDIRTRSDRFVPSFSICFTNDRLIPYRSDVSLLSFICHGCFIPIPPCFFLIDALVFFRLCRLSVAFLSAFSSCFGHGSLCLFFFYC